MQLSGKRVVVLGGTSGIGLATAAAAAERGASVVVASSSVKNVEAALRTLPDGAEGHEVDARDEQGLRAFFDEVGAFHHLVFTAGGRLLFGRLADLGLSDAKEAFGVRFWGAWLAAKYARDHLLPDGSITLSSGIAGARPQQGGSVVAPVCGAVEALTRALAVELAPVRVNTVAAGMVRTPLWDSLPAAVQDDAFARARQRLPSRTTGEASDIAEAHLHLMQARFTTGTVITIDGGAVLI
ncbi:SDR family oxidoreductase [Streptomyces sp. NPDC079020]|uniref:SDR family oxidoreductase n=1 Tax=Streptomyces sp. NPDC079020 TaxID=3365722 RepID=UPI0037CDE237